MDKSFLDHKRSVKADEIGAAGSGNIFSFWIPYYPDEMSQLPPQLPDPANNFFGVFPNERDKVLMSTPYFESMWGSSVSIGATKFAASGWALKSNKPRMQERFQNLLLNATVGAVASWVAFAAAGFSAFANAGKWFIEVERYTSRAGSRIKALHHLDPTRCWLTSDPQTPVLYLDKRGAYHELKAHQVIILMAVMDTTENHLNAPMSAAVMAYPSILQLAALKRFIYEKLSGRRPLAFHFLQGINDKTLRDVIANAQDEADARGVQAYMGAAMAAIMGDAPLNLITVPLAEIPDGIDVDQIRKYAHLEYANALGEDPTRIDPQLIGNRQLGAGAQAAVLDQKVKQGGMGIMLKQEFEHAIMQLLREEKIQFAFEETDLADDRARAEVAKIRADTRKTQIDSGEITPMQAANLAVDQGDLPPEFIPEDETLSEVITDDEQPEPMDENQSIANATLTETPLPIEAVTEKAIDPTDPVELASLIESQMEAAQRAFVRLSNG